MAEAITYLCPACGAYLRYDGKSGKWVCDFCNSQYTKEELEQKGAQTTQNHAPEQDTPDTPTEHTSEVQFSYDEHIADSPVDSSHLRAYHCPNCGAEIVTDDVTAATFCVFCQNPTVLPQQLSGKYQPAAMLPFATDKKQAQDAFLRLCKGKKLLPKGYTSRQRLEKITGVYVPYWLFDCNAVFDYHATGENHQYWSDSNFNYVKTDLYHIHRAGDMSFENIPLDASENMPDDLMDALEPFDFSKVEPFDLRYLTGYLAEKYTYEPKDLFTRMQNRISDGVEHRAAQEGRHYDNVYGVHCHTDYQSNQQTYLLLPVWMLVSEFQGKKYLFAMNGQTGKIVGELPCDKKRSVSWFFIIFVIALVITELIAFWIGGRF